MSQLNRAWCALVNCPPCILIIAMAAMWGKCGRMCTNSRKLYVSISVDYRVERREGNKKMWDSKGEACKIQLTHQVPSV